MRIKALGLFAILSLIALNIIFEKHSYSQENTNIDLNSTAQNFYDDDSTAADSTESSYLLNKDFRAQNQNPVKTKINKSEQQISKPVLEVNVDTIELPEIKPEDVNNIHDQSQKSDQSKNNILQQEDVNKITSQISQQTNKNNNLNISNSNVLKKDESIQNNNDDQTFNLPINLHQQPPNLEAKLINKSQEIHKSTEKNNEPINKKEIKNNKIDISKEKNDIKWQKNNNETIVVPDSKIQNALPSKIPSNIEKRNAKESSKQKNNNIPIPPQKLNLNKIQEIKNKKEDINTEKLNQKKETMLVEKKKKNINVSAEGQNHKDKLKLRPDRIIPLGRGQQYVKNNFNMMKEGEKTKLYIHPRKVYDHKNVILPETINKKKYRDENSHLPTKFYHKEYSSLLFKAVADDDTSAIQALLEKGADINARTKDKKDTPLMYAVQLKQIKSTRYLLSRGAQTHHKNYLGKTALHVAATNGDLNIIKALIKAGANIEDTDNKDNKRPAEYLQQMHGNIIMPYLVTHYKNSSKALIDSINLGSIAGAKQALKQNADVNYVDKRIEKNEDTPLLMAIKNNNISLVSLLILAGADTQKRNKQGYNAEELAKKLAQKKEYNTVYNIIKTINIKHELESAGNIIQRNSVPPIQEKKVTQLKKR